VLTTKPGDVTWLLRIVWVTLPLSVAPAIAEALDGSSNSTQAVASVSLWLGWFVGLVASCVPTTASLTAVRLLSPFPLATAGIAAFHHPSPSRMAIVGALLAAGAALVVALSGDVGRRFVQGSAYGDETRLPLRPPFPLVLILLPGLWLAIAAMLIVGPLSLAAHHWLVGSVFTVAGIGAAVLFARRCHRLTRRFAVFVPSGFVIHDHLLLADTAMFRRTDVRGFALAPFDRATISGPDAPADLTSKAVGTGVVATFADAATIVLAGTPGNRSSKAIHVRSGRITPTRPGAFLAEAARRGYDVSNSPRL
jgi:hypothetical protein